MTRSDEIDIYNFSFEDKIKVLTKNKTITFIISIPILTEPLLSYYVKQIWNRKSETLEIKLKEVVLYKNNTINTPNMYYSNKKNKLYRRDRKWTSSNCKPSKQIKTRFQW